MRVCDELRKIQILTNIMALKLRRDPFAYGDVSGNMMYYHNYRAYLINKLEDHGYVVDIEDGGLGKVKLYLRRDYFKR